jgi:hypothetical protein
MLNHLTTIQGKNGEIRQGILRWIEVPHNHIGEFWFFDRIDIWGMWGKLDYWTVIANGVKIHKLRVKVS